MMGSATASTHLIVIKILIVCMLAGSLNKNSSDAITKKKDCKCWEDFKPEKGTDGSYYCRGVKHYRIFGCNEEKPPICQCLVDGKIVELDLGELNCLGLDVVNGRWCHNREQFEEYFRKNPFRMIYD